VMAADEALTVAMRYTDEHPDTLLIVASDHGTGLGGVYGVGKFYRDSSYALAKLEARDASFDHIIDRLGDAPDDRDIIEIVRAHSGVTLTPEQVAVLQRAIHENVRASIHMAFNDQPHNSLAHVLHGGGAGRHPDRVNINFVTGQHVAGPVIVAAYGRGAEALDAAFVDNTDLFGWMLAALGARHENPLMSEDDALEALASGRVGASVAPKVHVAAAAV
jgi:alkaline phosphatase